MHTNAENPSFLLYGPLDALFEHQPYPELTGPHNVILGIAHTGICGSDVSIPPTKRRDHVNEH